MNPQVSNVELPSGLHDADIIEFSYDLQRASLVFKVDVWIGTMGDPAETRECYRRGALMFTGVLSFTKGESERMNDEQLTFLDYELREDEALRARLPEHALGKKAFAFYVLRCQMEIVCDDVVFEWSGEPALR